MEHSTLGKTGFRVSRIGFGCAPLSGHDYGTIDEAEAQSAIRFALDLGINLFDVADVYGFGRAEEFLGRALRGVKHDFLIATKIGVRWNQAGRTWRDCSREWLSTAIDQSLRRLSVDTIGLCQIHWPDGDTPFEETFQALEQCQTAGKIRFIGVSNFSVQQIADACSFADVATIQVPYNLLCREVERGALDEAAHRTLGVLAHSGLARGFLSGKRDIGGDFAGTDTRRTSRYFSRDGAPEKTALVAELRRIGRAAGESPSTIALRWVLANESVSTVLVGGKTRAQVQEAAQACASQLNLDERLSLEWASARCAGCFTGELSGKVA